MHLWRILQLIATTSESCCTFSHNRPPDLWLLECIDIQDETHDVKIFRFRIGPGADGLTPFCLHQPGQFVTLRLRFESVLVPRSYTISSSPSRPMVVTLTIKRDPNGLVSRFMHDEFKVGSRLPVRGPSGTLDLISVAPRDNIVMLSGGSGITPLMSMLRYIHDTRATQFNVIFLHSARSAADIIFRQELDLISNHLQMKLSFICEHDADVEMDEGLLTGDLLKHDMPDILNCTMLTCGPAPSMRAVRAMLGKMGFDMAHYHEERFGNPAEKGESGGYITEKLNRRQIRAAHNRCTQRTGNGGASRRASGWSR